MGWSARYQGLNRVDAHGSVDVLDHWAAVSSRNFGHTG
jgi:hypothetical protein